MYYETLTSTKSHIAQCNSAVIATEGNESVNRLEACIIQTFFILAANLNKLVHDK
jgi:hypothetical protein